ncbi:LLM class flavin-dependent oxidoreductase [Methylobacterium sp. 17Sr1-1]|uniref:LLM class flavin-dependent oxidoreductase n=1 Tax=Methylobacterium sp. 17Sr1-1 TaxID=2202826 RepID=UPI000D6F3B78|nr:LLM class flavin-dependent oxidoreductase [Methylobacterium sp. 17Sr1-1]AWN55223.1 5,10-methylene tetrahydromethanopterin reductase [Methylobacterium sp. 17Sr1-1]
MIRFNAFEMNCVGHQSPGLWRHPRDRSADYNTLAYWTDLARLLERGCFDGVFLADVVGLYDVHGGSPAAALRHAAQVPVNDPLLVVPAMAAVTEHLGFGVTVNLSYEAPYLLARRFTTLDHLTAGRIGWNVVTGYLDSAARAMGLDRQRAHDDRYDLAEEYMAVVYELWEGSWDDGAVRRDRAAGVFADPARVRAIRHEGPHFRVEGVHLGEPSPQRTPVIYQAGTSPKGRGFAARHAECVFVSGPSPQVIAPRVAALRQAASEEGRAPDDLLIYALATLVVAETDARARAKLAEYRSYVSHEGALALMSGWTGVDFSTLDLDAQVRHVENDAGRSAMDNVTRADPSRVWTVREVAEHVGIGGIGPVFCGSPTTVCDALEAFAAATGIDGFNLAYVVAHETFADIVELVVPELQRRGRYPTAYRDGPLRRKLFGRDRVETTHPAARHRHA